MDYDGLALEKDCCVVMVTLVGLLVYGV